MLAAIWVTIRATEITRWGGSTLSTYTGRYQSRFFNFVAEQSLRLGNAAAKAARHVRFAATTAAQAVLYPVYALFQTARRLDRQVRGGQRQQTPLPPADGPIHDILEDVAGLNLTSHQPIQALASSCSGGHLVLITPDNQVLDLLTREQQDYLDQQLLQAVAGYWHQSLKAVRPTPKPYPVRVFHRAMRWVQRSPLALSLNLFQETDIVQPVPKPRPCPPRESHPSALSPEAVALIDRHIAYLENEYLLPIVKEPEPVWVKVRLLVEAAIAYFFGDSDNDADTGLNPATASASADSLTGNHSPRLTAGGGAMKPHSNRATVTSHKSNHARFYHRIQDLIEGAIAYFLNLDSPRHPNVHRNLQTNPNRGDRALPDPWDTPELAAKYPFGIIAAATAAIPLPDAVSFKNPFGEFPRTPTNPDSPGNLTYPQQPKSGKPQVVQPPRTAMTTSPTWETSGEMDTLAAYSQDEWQPDFKPEWIEAYVNDAHYVRHPLEVILHWLDNLLLKLETWVIRLWKRLFR